MVFHSHLRSRQECRNYEIVMKFAITLYIRFRLRLPSCLMTRLNRGYLQRARTAMPRVAWATWIKWWSDRPVTAAKPKRVISVSTLPSRQVILEEWTSSPNLSTTCLSDPTLAHRNYVFGSISPWTTWKRINALFSTSWTSRRAQISFGKGWRRWWKAAADRNGRGYHVIRYIFCLMFFLFPFFEFQYILRMSFNLDILDFGCWCHWKLEKRDYLLLIITNKVIIWSISIWYPRIAICRLIGHAIKPSILFWILHLQFRYASMYIHCMCIRTYNTSVSSRNKLARLHRSRAIDVNVPIYWQYRRSKSRETVSERTSNIQLLHQPSATSSFLN